MSFRKSSHSEVCNGSERRKGYRVDSDMVHREVPEDDMEQIDLDNMNDFQASENSSFNIDNIFTAPIRRVTLADLPHPSKLRPRKNQFTKQQYRKKYSLVDRYLQQVRRKKCEFQWTCENETEDSVIEDPSLSQQQPFDQNTFCARARVRDDSQVVPTINNDSCHVNKDGSYGLKMSSSHNHVHTTCSGTVSNHHTKEVRRSTIVHSEEITRSSLNLSKVLREPLRNNGNNYSNNNNISGYSIMSRLQSSFTTSTDKTLLTNFTNPIITTGEVTRKDLMPSSNYSEENKENNVILDAQANCFHNMLQNEKHNNNEEDVDEYSSFSMVPSSVYNNVYKPIRYYYPEAELQQPDLAHLNHVIDYVKQEEEEDYGYG